MSAPKFSLAVPDAKEIAGVRSAPLRAVWQFYCWRMTRAGRWLLWPTVGFLAYTSASLEYQAYVPLAYILALWAVALASAAYFRPSVKLQARHADRVSAGETLPVEIEIEQTGRWPHDLRLSPHRLPLEIDAAPEDGVPLPPLIPGQKTKTRLGLHCPRRGVYKLPGYRVESDFPFGILRSFDIHEQERPLLVCPTFTPLSRLELPTGRRLQPGGVALAAEMGDSVEFIGNREYREGDNVRDIDWRATARLGRPIVREYKEEYFLRVAVILDTHVPVTPHPALSRMGRGMTTAAGGRDARGTRRQSFEHAVSLTAAAGEYLARKEYIVDIFAAGPNLYHLTAGRSLAYLDQILDILACVEENPNEPFGVIEPELMFYLARISSVICVFLDWNETRRAFAHRLEQEGVGLKCVVLSDTPCALDPAADGVPLVSHKDFKAGIDEL